MVIDLIFLILMLLAVIKGYRRGFIIAIFSFVAIIIGLAAALKLSATVAGWLSQSTSINTKWLPFISFLLVMLGVGLLVKACAKLIEEAVKIAMMGFLNKLAGIVLYMILYSIIFSVLLFYADKMHILKSSAISNSLCYHYIEPIAPKIIDAFGDVIPVFKNLFDQLEKFFASFA